MRRLLAAALVVSFPAHAGRPLTTEDADTLDDKSCQVEAWIDRSSVETQAWMVPACNFGLGIEWQLGFSNSWSEGASRFPGGYFQGKAAWGTLRDGGWSVGAVAGIVRHRHEPKALAWENPYGLGIVSWVVGEVTTFHVNLGWTRHRAVASDSTLWGVAVERAMASGITLLAESFGDDHSKPFFRIGGRYAAIKDKLDLDLSFVTRASGTKSDRFISLGLHAQADRILP